MSNNDLPCKKCGCQHHPVECPMDLDMEQGGLMDDKIYEDMAKALNCAIGRMWSEGGSLEKEIQLNVNALKEIVKLSEVSNV